MPLVCHMFCLNRVLHNWAEKNSQYVLSVQQPDTGSQNLQTDARFTNPAVRYIQLPSAHKLSHLMFSLWDTASDIAGVERTSVLHMPEHYQHYRHKRLIFWTPKLYLSSAAAANCKGNLYLLNTNWKYVYIENNNAQSASCYTVHALIFYQCYQILALFCYTQ